MTLLDSSVLIDLLERREVWSDWSLRQLTALQSPEPVVVNQIAYAEASAPYSPQADFDKLLDVAWLRREELPWDAAFLAAKAHAAYRRQGGQKAGTLPDFLITSHAMVKGYRLLTRDAARIRSYFPDVEIVAPDTHP